MKEKYTFIFLRKIDSTFFIYRKLSMSNVPTKMISLGKKTYNVDLSKPFLTKNNRNNVEHVYYIDYDSGGQVLNEKEEKKESQITNTNVTKPKMLPEELHFGLKNHILSDLAGENDKKDNSSIFGKIFIAIFGVLAGCVLCYLYLQNTHIMIPIS